MRSDPLKDAVSGRPRPFPQGAGDRKDAVGCVGIMLILAVAYSVWHERSEGPRHERNARAALARAGYPDAQMTRKWISLCGRGSKGYAWRAGSVHGVACSYGDGPSASVTVRGYRARRLERPDGRSGSTA